MTQSDYIPLTRLEATVRDAMAGTGDERDILAALMKAVIIVPSASAVTPDGKNLTPLIVPGQRYQGPKIVIFDDRRHLGPQVVARAPYWLEVDSAWLVKSMAPDHGLTLFVGPTIASEISAEQLAEERRLLLGG